MAANALYYYLLGERYNGQQPITADFNGDIVEIAAAGNAGVNYPFAPAVWANVVSASAARPTPASSTPIAAKCS